MDRYELQVLDSYENKTYFDGQASAIYKQTPPMVNAMRAAGRMEHVRHRLECAEIQRGWLAGDACLHHRAAQRRADARTTSRSKAITPFTEVPHYEKHGKSPIHLQNHGNPVRYRNIWVREIKPIVGVREREPFMHDHATGKDIPVKDLPKEEKKG